MRHQRGAWSGVLRVVAVCLALAAAPGVAAAGNSVAADSSRQLTVGNIRSGLTHGRSRIVFDLDNTPAYRISSLSDPERIIVEIQAGRLRVAPAPDLFDGTPVTGFYTEQVEDSLRLVLELAQALAHYDGFYLRPFAEGEHHRLVVDLYTIAPDGVAEPELIHSPAPPARSLPPAESPPSQKTDGRSRTVRAPAAGSAGSRPDMRFSGTVQQEWAYATAQNEHQKFETLVTPRWDLALGDVNFTAVGRIRLDAVGDLGPAERHPANYSEISRPWLNRKHLQLALREFYADFQVGKSDWRIGKQQVVWGQADGIKVLDVVNPQSFREFILNPFDESRIPLWLANINVPVGETGNLQLLWIPDTTYHEPAELGSPYAARSPRLIPPLPITALADIAPPDDPWADGDFGIQLGSFRAGWDFTFNYLYHYLDTPALPVRQLPSGQLVLVPEYRRSHLVGGTASTNLGGVTLRSELAYSSDTFQPLSVLRDDAVGKTPELSTVLGLDWMPSAEVLFSTQWFYSYLADHDSAMARDASEHLLTLLYQQDFANAAWRFRAIGIYSPNDGDSLLQLSLSYWIRGNARVWVGADVFSGTRGGLFGQYSHQDRMLLGLEYGF